MNTEKPIVNVEKEQYIAPAALIVDIETEQVFLQTAGSGTLPGGGNGGDW